MLKADRASCLSRALTLWPGLDRARLAQTRGDPRRIARLVSRQTAETPEVIIAMLTGSSVALNGHIERP